MKIVFLDALTVADLTPELDRFGELGDFTLHHTTTPDQTVERLSGARVAISNKVVIGAEELEQLPDLQLICIAATGMNNVDLDAAAARGVRVTNVKGYSTESVTQHTFALLFALMENLFELNEAVYDGTYAAHTDFGYWKQPYYEVAGKRWGIIGLGAIGRRVGEVATAFGSEVVYYSTSGRNTTGQPYPHLPLEELLRSSDVVTIHCPLNEQTRDLLDESELALLKPSAYLVNVGRGGIVNEPALVRALDAGRFAGAAMDVFTREPIPADHPYLSIRDRSRLLLTPHVGWASVTARRTLLRTIYDQIADFSA